VLFCLLLALCVNGYAGESCRDAIRDGSCEYYLCEEASHHFGAEGYFLRFAHPYCLKFFGEVIHQMSPSGAEWMRRVGRCLQEDLLASHGDTTGAEELEAAAISLHAECYLRTGLCALPLQDRLLVMETIAGELSNPRVFLEALQVITGCLGEGEGESP
jgi:hypothetical protein